jgi:hypothetical protein
MKTETAPPAVETPGSDLTVRERMEEMGWQVGICEDTCSLGWMKVDPDTRHVVAYEKDGKFNADLEACQRAYGLHEGRSYYL